MQELLANSWEILLIVASIVGGGVWLRSDIAKKRHVELEQLVATRGDTIEDLRDEITDMRREMDEMKGEMKALRNFKAEEIADKVVERLESYLAK